jgi:hypothetical protein
MPLPLDSEFLTDMSLDWIECNTSAVTYPGIVKVTLSSVKTEEQEHLLNPLGA